MSDYYRDATTPKARKRYVCIACGWYIPQGEQHVHQTGVYDVAGFSNRFHNECWEAMKLGDFEDGFVTGEIPVPERFKEESEAHWASVRAERLASTEAS